jgi:uncharacterized protein (DUF362 family)
VHSAHHRSVTVVTIVTLIFTPVLKHHKWVEMLTGVKTDTQIVKCQPNDPCPAQKTIVQKVVLPPKQ